MWDPYAEFKKEVLLNGLTIYVAHWPNCPAETVRFLVHSGAEQDPIGLEGLAHFVEHTVSSSVEDISVEDIENFFEDVGGSVMLGYAGFPSTFYGFTAPISKKILSKSFSIFGEMLINGKLSNRIEEERGTIIGEFYEDYPTDYSFELQARKHSILYPVNHYLNQRISILGKPLSIKKIQEKDLQDFHDDHYHPANMSIICVGGIDFEKIISLINNSPFAKRKKGKKSFFSTSLEDVIPLNENRILIKSSDYLKEEINHCGYQSLIKIPTLKISHSALSVFNDMLQAVLLKEIRTRKGWTYNITVNFDRLRDLYEFKINCRAFNPDAKNDFESLVENLVFSLPSEKKLFKKTINRRIASDIAKEYVSEKVCKGALMDIIYNNRIISIKEEHQNLRKLRLKDIEELLYWFKPEFRLTQLIIP